MPSKSYIHSSGIEWIWHHLQWGKASCLWDAICPSILQISSLFSKWANSQHLRDIFVVLMCAFYRHEMPIGGTASMLALVASMSGFIFGYDTRQISNIFLMNDYVTCSNPLSTIHSGLIISFLSISTLAGAVTGKYPMCDVSLYIHPNWHVQIDEQDWYIRQKIHNGVWVWNVHHWHHCTALFLFFLAASSHWLFDLWSWY